MLNPACALLRFNLLALLLTLAVTPCAASASSPIPPPPHALFLDQTGALTAQQRKVLETLLIEHADASGERILVAVFKSLDGEDLAKRTHEIFEAWLGDRGRDPSALLAVYLQDEKAQLETSVGLETLSESTTRAILRNRLLPDLNADHLFKGLCLSLLELLRADESPLIDSGRADQLIQEGGIDIVASSHSLGPGSWFVFVLLGTLVFGAVLNNILSAEAHFTSQGWYHPNPWKIFSLHSLRSLRRDPPKGAGGIDGHW